MQGNGVAGNLLQSHTANGAHLCAEVAAQQVFTQSDRLEDLRTTIGTDGRDTHLRHDLLQALIHRLDVVFLCGGVLLLNLAMLHQIIEHGEGHVRAQGTGSVAQQQGCVHHLTDLAALHNQCRLHTLTHTNQIVVDCRDSQKTGNRSVCLVEVAIAQDDVVHTFIDTLLSFLAEIVECLAKSAFTLRYLKENGQLLGVETLVADVT